MVLKIDFLKYKKIFIILALVGIVLFQFFNNLIILEKDQRIFTRDPLFHYKWSVGAKNCLESEDCKFRSYFHGIRRLYSLLPVPFYFIFGVSQNIASFTNLLYLSILAYSVFGIGRHLYSIREGIIASFIVSIFPGIFSMSRTFNPEFTVPAMVALSIYLMLKTDYFKSRKYSLALTISIFFGVLLKENTYPLFFIGPFLYYLFLFYSKRKKNLGALKNLSIFLVLTICLVLPLYNSLTKSEIKTDITSNINLSEAPDVKHLWACLTFYIKALFKQVTPIFTLLFLASLVVFPFTKRKKEEYILFIWFLLPFCFLTFVTFRHQYSKFSLGYLPAVALILCSNLNKISSKKIKIFLISFLLIFGLIRFFIISYQPLLWPRESDYFWKTVAWTNPLPPYDNSRYSIVFRNNSKEIISLINDVDEYKSGIINITYLTRDSLISDFTSKDVLTFTDLGYIPKTSRLYFVGITNDTAIIHRYSGEVLTANRIDVNITNIISNSEIVVIPSDPSPSPYYLDSDLHKKILEQLESIAWKKRKFEYEFPSHVKEMLVYAMKINP